MCHISKIVVPTTQIRRFNIKSIEDISRQLKQARDFHKRLTNLLDTLYSDNYSADEIKLCEKKIQEAKSVVDFLVKNGDAIADSISSNSLANQLLKIASKEREFSI